MKKILPLIIAVIVLLSGCFQSSHDTSIPESTEPEAPPEAPYVKEIVTSFTANFILTSNGDVYSWGENEQGVLGLGKELAAKVITPQKVVLDEPIKKLVTSSLANTVFAISESGTVYGWGGNLYKTISGDEISVFYTPVQINFDIDVSEIALSHHIVTILSKNGDAYGYGWSQGDDGLHWIAMDERLFAGCLWVYPAKTEAPYIGSRECTGAEITATSIAIYKC